MISENQKANPRSPKQIFMFNDLNTGTGLSAFNSSIRLLLTLRSDRF